MSPHPAEPELSSRRILLHVTTTVTATLLIWYITALLSFAGNTYGYNNRFTEVAVSHHWSYLLWSNVVVLKGYLLVALGFVAMIYPMIMVWQRHRPTSVRGIILRSALLAIIGYAIFVMRLAVERPYFGDFSYMEASYRWLGQLFGKVVQDAVVGFLIHTVPAITVGAVALYYLNGLRQRISRQGWPRSVGLIVALCCLALFIATGYGLSRTEALSLVGDKPKPKPRISSSSDQTPCAEITSPAMATQGPPRPTLMH
jgi:hypothetical protein